MSVEFEQLVDKPKSKSKVWKHFGFPADVDGAIKHKKKIVCRLCKAVVAYSGNTTNLSHHLQRSHWRDFSELSERGGDKPGPSISPTAKQLTLPGAVERSIPFPHDSEKHKRLVNATADFICQGLQPLRVVDEVSFRGLLEIAEPRFQLPHRTHFTDKVIPAKYRAVRASVENQLATIEQCTMTTDLWTSQHQQRAYISLTVHFVDDDFELKSGKMSPNPGNTSGSQCKLPEGSANHHAQGLEDLEESVWRYYGQRGQHCQCHWSDGNGTLPLFCTHFAAVH